MNGPAEVASGVVDSLKTQPLMLAMVVINLALVGLLYYVAIASSGGNERELQMILQACVK